MPRRGIASALVTSRWRRPTAVAAALLAMSTVAACGASHPSTSATSAPASSAPPPPPHLASCAKPGPANPVFSHVSGNHLIDTRGRVMIPYGITVFGLALPDWQAGVTQDRRQITAAITKWCTNYVRLQVAPANLLSARPYNAAYLAEVRREVQLALGYDDNVILTAQTEKTKNLPGSQPAAGPTAQTVQFWRVLAPLYKHNPRVWFDVFNEPRLKGGPSLWTDWRNGATVAGQHYLGMQQLVSAVRAAAGDRNLIVVEGPRGAQTLSAVGSNRITGANVAYAVHPYKQTSPAVWTSNFGQAARTVPVLADEWSTSSLPRHGSCGPSPATWVPEFFSYLRQRQIGLGAWGLVPGVLVSNPSTFTPTTLAGSFTCVQGPQAKVVANNAAHNGSRPVPPTQGVGELVQAYFARYSRPGAARQ